VYGLYRRMQPTNQRPSLGGTGTGGEAGKRPSAGLAQVCYGHRGSHLQAHPLRILKGKAPPQE
jgi:hypothetical protein